MAEGNGDLESTNTGMDLIANVSQDATGSTGAQMAPAARMQHQHCPVKWMHGTIQEKSHNPCRSLGLG